MNSSDLVLNIISNLLDYEPCTAKQTYDTISTEYSNASFPAVRQVIFNANATIVYFDDDTKVVVRKSSNDIYNKEHAIVYAIVKRAYGRINPENGEVEGNGMGNMLGRLIKNAIVQDASFIKEKTFSTTESEMKNESRYFSDKKSFTRDSKGRFVKKANRN